MALSNFVYNLFLFSIVHSSKFDFKYFFVYTNLNLLVPMPPTILTEPDSEIIFDPRVNLELPCLAKGTPTPIYSWTKNGQLYQPTGQNNHVNIAIDSGSLTFTQPEMLDQGLYQCNATNIWGK